MGLIRFEQADGRGPSAALLLGIPDWVSGSLAPQYGSVDFEDYVPFLGATVGQTNEGTALAERDDINGVVRMTASAGTNAEAGIVRRRAVVLDSCQDFVLEAKFNPTVGAATDHINIVGLTDQAVADVLASNALAVSSNQDFLGLRWNTDAADGGEIDLVAIEDGTLTVLVENVANEDTDRGSDITIGFRFHRTSATMARISPSVNGVILPNKRVNIAVADYDNMLAATLRPCVVVGAAGNTTAPIVDLDWLFTLDRNRT